MICVHREIPVRYRGPAARAAWRVLTVDLTISSRYASMDGGRSHLGLALDVRATAPGRPILATRSVAHLTDEAARIAMVASLSRETLRTLQLVATGLSTSEAAARLGLPSERVRGRIREAITALNARSKLEAVVIALREGLIDLSDD
jgi:DNA-binding NarL/FixJ family response regulator